MKIDFWYPGEKIAYVDCYFCDSDCIYRGNLYNDEKRPIGDFSSRDSVEIEKRFPGIFG